MFIQALSLSVLTDSKRKMFAPSPERAAKVFSAINEKEGWLAGERQYVMESRAKLLRHPAHQLLIVFPLGLWATAVIFDGISGCPAVEGVKN
ncbi:hypothetical protein GCM10023187_11880 [Nibrella viscosa]|uniref:Uncharacterized protein n=1 Tax=Nibrella viscosa TaxID=1084524 RepID=A0ABP8K2D1_9BACT